MSQSARKKCGPKKEVGAALFIVIFLAAIAAMTIFVSQLNSISQRAEQLGNAASVKLDGKNALLGYVSTNGSPDFWGLLPLPDMGKRDTTNDHIEGESPLNFGANPARALLANSNDALLIGRLPSKTLGIPALRDNTNNCLWYAISAAFKASNSGASYVPSFNWDTLGDFETGLSNNPHESRAVALIFGPGTPSNNQSRSPNGLDEVNECGGNYVAGNYLESLTAANPTTDSNQAVYVLPSAETSPSTPPAPAFIGAFQSGTIGANDQVASITASEIFQQIAMAGKIQSTIKTLLYQLKSCLEAKELPNIGLTLINSIPSGQSRYIGPLAPSGTAANQIDCIATITNANAKELARWRDNFWYLICNTPSSGCLQLTDTTGTNVTESCDGIIAFSGARTNSQRRTNALEKNDPEQYFELDDATPNSPTLIKAFRSEEVSSVKARSALSGIPAELSQDVALCLKRPLAASNPTVTLSNLVDTPATVAGNTFVNRDPATEIITLGNPAVSGGVGATFSNATPVVGMVLSAKNARLVLPSSASGADNFYSGMSIEILSGSGSGQTGTIALYDQASKTATINSQWNPLPTTSSVIRVSRTFLKGEVIPNSNELGFPTTASAQNNAYSGMTVDILSGPGAGQTRTISSYAGGTRTANVSVPWSTPPTTDSVFRLVALNGNAVAAANPQITLADSAGTQNNAYVGFAVEITSGTGAGQSRVISDYDGTTQKATIETAWDTVPDINSEFRIDVGMPPFGKGMRAYFRAKILQNGATYTAGPGFVFALFDADRNLDKDNNPTPLVSGIAGPSGQYLGYAGRNIDGNGLEIGHPIDYPKIGLEFDTMKNSGNGTTKDTTDAHLALVYWGYSHDSPNALSSLYDDDNTHRVPLTTSAQTGYIDPYNASAFGYPSLRDPSAVNRDFHVRFEIERQYPVASNVGRYISRIWIVKAVDGMIPGMSNLTQDFTNITSIPPSHAQTIEITDLATGTEAFKRFRFGFTNAQSTRTQEVTIQALKLRLR